MTDEGSAPEVDTTDAPVAPGVYEYGDDVLSSFEAAPDPDPDPDPEPAEPANVFADIIEDNDVEGLSPEKDAEVRARLADILREAGRSIEDDGEPDDSDPDSDTDVERTAEDIIAEVERLPENKRAARLHELAERHGFEVSEATAREVLIDNAVAAYQSGDADAQHEAAVALNEDMSHDTVLNQIAARVASERNISESAAHAWAMDNDPKYRDWYTARQDAMRSRAAKQNRVS